MSRRPATCSPISSSSTPTAKRSRRRGTIHGRFPQITGSQREQKDSRAAATRLPRARFAVIWLPAVFPAGSIYAGLAVLLWLPVFYGGLSLHSAFAPRDWHVHEMLYATCRR